jgi:hypothetical protein
VSERNPFKSNGVASVEVCKPITDDLAFKGGLK